MSVPPFHLLHSEDGNYNACQKIRITLTHDASEPQKSKSHNRNLKKRRGSAATA
jgi:azurin